MINMIGICRWKNLGRWDYFTIPHLPVAPGLSHVPLLELLLSRNEYVDRKKCAFQDLQPISIHFDGSISKRVVAEGREYTLPLLWARSGDIALSKIDLKNGAVAVVPDDWESVVVTTHFKVYRPNMERLNPNYFRLLIQTAPFKNWLWANRSGADGRTEVKLDIFESLEIPLPTISEQDELLAAYSSALAEAAMLEAEAERIETEARCAFETALGVALPPPMQIDPSLLRGLRILSGGVMKGCCRA